LIAAKIVFASVVKFTPRLSSPLSESQNDKKPRFSGVVLALRR
jgi:hypothetical protein